ncbi:MAG TPA: hypothetical protein PK014_00120 [Thermoanaerobaculia bacterium]|nr:hypothetical protein [Thermoanaerobaculia bacterium]HXK69119.1 hypothetical protein [Thermoanaerobaculia bacterium]
MERIQTIAIQAPSRPGVLGEIFRSMTQAGVGLRALLASDGGHSGIVHLVPEDVDTAKEILNNLTFPYSIEEAFFIPLCGSEKMKDLLHTLALARINITSIFTTDFNTVIFATDAMDKTEKLVRENLSL